MLASELDHLDAILLSAFSQMNVVPGKKALQKLVYFLKESGLDIGFKFQWDKWGPYSGELATYVDDLVAENLLESKEEKVHFGSRVESKGLQYNFAVAPRAITLLDSVSLPASETSKVERVMKLVHEISPANLELYASVHFMVKFLTTKGERDRLPESLVDLMDDYKRGRFDDTQIKRAYYNLRTMHWL